MVECLKTMRRDRTFLLLGMNREFQGISDKKNERARDGGAMFHKIMVPMGYPKFYSAKMDSKLFSSLEHISRMVSC